MMSAFFQQQQKKNSSNREIDFWNKKFDNLGFFFLISPKEKKMGEN